jgi:hypothetical protein
MPKTTTIDKQAILEEFILLLRENNSLMRSIAEDVRKIKLNTS